MRFSAEPVAEERSREAVPFPRPKCLFLELLLTNVGGSSVGVSSAWGRKCTVSAHLLDYSVFLGGGGVEITGNHGSAFPLSGGEEVAFRGSFVKFPLIITLMAVFKSSLLPLCSVDVWCVCGGTFTRETHVGTSFVPNWAFVLGGPPESLGTFALVRNQFPPRKPIPGPEP